MLNTYEQHSRTKYIAIVLSVIIIAGIVVLADHLKAASATTASTVSPTTRTVATSPSSGATTTGASSQAANTATTPSTTSGYKDGAYSAASQYYVPNGNQSIEVHATLQNGVITDVSIKNSESDRDSAAFQEDFASEYKSYVVGKKISSLRLSVIAGASDTTQAFSDAISQIASKAQA